MNNSDHFAMDEEFHVGAKLLLESWWWQPEQNKIMFHMKWYPGQPNLDNFLDYCLAVRKSKDDVSFKNVGHFVDFIH